MTRFNSLFDNLHLTNSERNLIQTIQTDPLHFIQTNIDTLSESCFVSKSSIYRFARKLQCSGLHELQLKIAAMMPQKENPESFNDISDVIALRLLQNEECTIICDDETYYETKILQRHFESLGKNISIPRSFHFISLVRNLSSSGFVLYILSESTLAEQRSLIEKSSQNKEIISLSVDLPLFYYEAHDFNHSQSLLSFYSTVYTQYKILMQKDKP